MAKKIHRVKKRTVQRFPPGLISEEAKGIIILVQKRGLIYKSEVKEKLQKYPSAIRKKVLREIKAEKSVKVLRDRFEYITNPTSKPNQKNELYDLFTEEGTVEEKSSYLKIDRTYFINITAVGFPDDISSNFLADLWDENVGASMVVEPTSVHRVLSYLNRILEEAEDKIHQYTTQGLSTPADLKQHRDEIKKHLDEIKSEKRMPLMFSLSLSAQGSNLKQALAQAEKVTNILTSKQLILKLTTNHHQDVYLSMVPLGRSILERRKAVTTTDLIAENFP